MKNVQGRKALIVLSDGVDTGCEATLGEALESALRGDTLTDLLLLPRQHLLGPGQIALRAIFKTVDPLLPLRILFVFVRIGRIIPYRCYSRYRFLRVFHCRSKVTL